MNMTHSVTLATWLNDEDESREMMAMWPNVVRDLTDVVKNLDIPDVTKWFAKMLQYNVPGGKKVRGLSLIYAYKLLMPNNQLTEDNIRLMRILAWCVEMVQAYGIIIDDIQDRSLLRRNQKCWYRYNDIGVAATNDCLLLEASIYYLIRKHFKTKEYYIEIFEIFQDVTMKALLGQSLDLLSSNFGKKPNLDLFTIDRYNAICKYKSSYYSSLPIIIAMRCAGIKDPEMFREAKTILLEMGYFFQVQDDYLGCYGDAQIIGKDSTDIEEGKCTWLVIMALQRATPMQRKILEECYGVSDPENVSRVKQLYNDLDLLNVHSIYEEETYNLLNIHIQKISHNLLQGLFLYLSGKIYRRVKKAL